MGVVEDQDLRIARGSERLEENVDRELEAVAGGFGRELGRFADPVLAALEQLGELWDARSEGRDEGAEGLLHGPAGRLDDLLAVAEERSQAVAERL